MECGSSISVRVRISLFVCKSNTSTAAFFSAVRNRRWPARSTAKWSKSPSWRAGNGIDCKRTRGAFACPQAPIADAINTVTKAFILNLYTLASSRVKFKDDPDYTQTERGRELFESFRHAAESKFNISARFYTDCRIQRTWYPLRPTVS